MSASGDKTLKYWSIADGTCIKTFVGHTRMVYSVVISTNGQYALSGSLDKTIKYWLISNGSCIRTFTGHTDYVTSVAIAPDGQYALSGSCDDTIKYWRISDGMCLRTFTGHSEYVMSVVFSPDGQYVLSGSNDNTMKYWKISDGACIRTFQGEGGDVMSVDISHDGKYAFCGTGVGYVNYFRISDGERMFYKNNHTGPCNSVSILPDGEWALSVSQEIRYWHLPYGYSTGFGSDGIQYSVDASADGLYALVGYMGNVLKYWRISDGTCIRTFAGHTGIVQSVCFSPLGSGFEDGKSSSSLPSSLSAHPNPFTTRLSLSLPSPASIYSLTGTLIKTLPKGKQEIDTSSWKAGVYFIRLNQGSKGMRIVRIAD
jgi:WD40 repeat protein